MRKLIFFLLIILSNIVVAQNDNVKSTTTEIIQSGSNSSVEMADKFRADGKIYVVIGVVAIILSGLFVYLIMLDRKINKIEKEVRTSSK